MRDAPKTITKARWLYHPEDMDDIKNALVHDQYTLTASVASRLKAADELAEAIDEWQISRIVGCLELEQAKAENVARLRTAYRARNEIPD